MSTGLDLFRLLVFVTVVDRSGYSAAAEHLNVSQATVSFHVQALERWFGDLRAGAAAGVTDDLISRPRLIAVTRGRPCRLVAHEHCDREASRR
jgi:Bacterial regulatory helix-turn-helix protein, lysR family